jgi:hypothetical protein
LQRANVCKHRGRAPIRRRDARTADGTDATAPATSPMSASFAPSPTRYRRRRHVGGGTLKTAGTASRRPRARSGDKAVAKDQVRDPQIVLLPGLDGTARLFNRFIAAAPTSAIDPNQAPIVATIPHALRPAQSDYAAGVALWKSSPVSSSRCRNCDATTES